MSSDLGSDLDRIYGDVPRANPKERVPPARPLSAEAADAADTQSDPESEGPSVGTPLALVRSENGDTPPGREPLPLRTDLGNAELFVRLHGERFRHVKERRAWLVWQRGRWRLDGTGEAERAAKETARELMRQAIELEGEEQKSALAHGRNSQSAARIRAMIELASTEPDVAIATDQLDADPWALSCANGTVDLRTGELRPHDPADLISLGTEIRYENATCPRWHRFLEEVFGGDDELVGFVRRAVGYSLTGETGEHVLFVLHGTGANGKTTFIETIKIILGDLASTAAFESFVRTRGDRGVRNDLARLHRARLVAAAESGDGRRLDEAIVKTLTGGDRVAARFLYGEFFEFRPRFKLWLVTNHRPRVDGDDDAIWRRIRLIPFEVSFQGREDRELSETLRAELSGILRWAVEGSLEWQSHGLGLPPAVARATEEYRQDEDVLGAFLDERCEVGSGEIEVPQLRESYEAFCGELGEKPLSRGALGKRLAKRGIASEARGGKRFYGNVRLR